jgi:hypothetical protein
VEAIDGVRVEFRVVEHAQTEQALVVSRPDERVIIP